METITIAAIWQWITAVVIPAMGTLIWTYRNEIKSLGDTVSRQDEKIKAITDRVDRQEDAFDKLSDKLDTVRNDILSVLSNLTKK